MEKEETKDYFKRLARYSRELERAGATVILSAELEKAFAGIDKSEETKSTTFKTIDLDPDELMGMIMDSVVPACCIYGCNVEPDGHCSHGNPSILIHMGFM